MDINLMILVLNASEKVITLMLQVILLQAHQVLHLRTVEAGQMELLK